MKAFAQACRAIAATSSKNAKIELVSDYLKTLDDADLEAATRFFTGNPFAARDQRNLNLGGRAIVSVAESVWGFTGAQLSAGYRVTGDLGSALGPLAKPSGDLMLFGHDSLSPSTLKARFDEIADATGKNAGKRRESILEGIFRSCTDALEATYVIKIITGDLRIGLREGLVHDAIALAFDSTHRAVHRDVNGR